MSLKVEEAWKCLVLSRKNWPSLIITSTKESIKVREWQKSAASLSVFDCLVSSFNADVIDGRVRQ